MSEDTRDPSGAPSMGWRAVCWTPGDPHYDICPLGPYWPTREAAFVDILKYREQCKARGVKPYRVTIEYQD